MASPRRLGPDVVPRQASVLHVGTALARMMVVTVDSCAGLRACASVVSIDSEVLGDGLSRLTDDEWKERLMAGNQPPTVPWLAPLFGE